MIERAFLLILRRPQRAKPLTNGKWHALRAVDS
jgi:hypothetical protein